jgi:glycosyltransferase involved in cell wall biosynthesis
MSDKKRIAIYYDNRYGRNDGPPLFFFNQLKKREDLEVVHLLPIGDTLKDVGPMDYHFWVDWGEDALHYPEWHIPKDGGKTIYVVSDAHIDNGYRYKKAREFDYVFFNQVRFMQEYNPALALQNQKVSWLPHAFEPQAYPNITTIKKYDVCFVGHIQADQPNYNGISRVMALDRLFKEFPEFYFGSRHPAYPGKNMFEDAARRFSESKIVFNISIKDDINMRVFEVMGTGSFLLTNWLPTLGELFEDGKDLVTYKTYDEMVEKARYYIDHEEEREKIAQNGYNKVIQSHTYKNRIDKILGMVQ